MALEVAGSFAHKKIKMVGNGEVFQMGFPNQLGQQSQSVLQIQRFQGNTTLLTIVVCLYQLILVIHGKNLILNGQENIIYELFGPSQLTRSSQSVKGLSK